MRLAQAFADDWGRFVHDLGPEAQRSAASLTPMLASSSRNAEIVFIALSSDWDAFNHIRRWS